MTADTIAITDIDASERLRPLDPDTVTGYAAIAEQRVSEGKRPLIQPIIVRPVKEGFKLTAGGHRLAALLEIGWEVLVIGVDVIVRPMDDHEAFEDEVFENLANAGLNALDRMIFLAEAKEIADTKRGETRGRKSKVDKLQGDKKVPESGIISSPRFTKAAAMRMGLAESVVREAVQIAKALDAETIAELRGTTVEDNHNELKQLLSIPAEKRRAAAAAIKRGEAKKVSEARVAIGLDEKTNDDPQARFYNSAIDVWGKLDKLHRANFLDAIGVPKEVAKKIVGNEISTDQGKAA